MGEEDEAEHSFDGEIVGTPGYMSPEQTMGERTGMASDIYALGATLYALLAGRSPYSGLHVMDILRQKLEGEPPLPRQVNPDVPPALEAICLKAMSRKPDHRYRSAGMMAEDLRRFLDGRELSFSPSARSLAPLRRSAWAGLLAISLVVSSFAGILWSVLTHRFDRPGQGLLGSTATPAAPKHRQTRSSASPQTPRSDASATSRQARSSFAQAAELAFRGAVATCEARFRSQPSLLAARRDLAIACANLGFFLIQADRPDEAAELFGRASFLLGSVPANDVSAAPYRNALDAARAVFDRRAQDIPHQVVD
jgi:serine/threonine protein kinase